MDFTLEERKLLAHSVIGNINGLIDISKEVHPIDRQDFNHEIDELLGLLTKLGDLEELGISLEMRCREGVH